MALQRDRLLDVTTIHRPTRDEPARVLPFPTARVRRRAEHRDWRPNRLFEETKARAAAEFDHKALTARHTTVLARLAAQERALDHWQDVGGWLLLAACTGWLAFGLVLLAYVRGL